MRTAIVSGGFHATLLADVSDTWGGLEDAEFYVALVPEGTKTIPAYSDTGAGWQKATVVQAADGYSVLAWVVDSTQPLGHFHVAAYMLDSGRREAFWAQDPDGPERRILVYVC